MSTVSETIDEAAGEAVPKPSLVLRLKRLLVAPLLLWHRLRRPLPAAATEKAEDAPPARAHDRRGDEKADETAEVPAGPALWRRALPLVLACALGAIAAAGAASWLTGRIIVRQTGLLSAQEAEIVRLKGVLAGYDRMMLQNKKKLEEEQGRRAEAENRLAQAQSDLARRLPPADAAAGLRAGPAGGRPGAGKTGDCTLHPGSIGSTLKGCLEEFSR